MHALTDYAEIVGDESITEIFHKAQKLSGQHILHINSSYHGGGVAEILGSLVPLMNDCGIETGWRLLRGNPDFFRITKMFHNALQGEPSEITQMDTQIYQNTVQEFACYTHLDHDCVIIHDPQPLPLINFYRKKQPWIWRCHIDLTDPNNTIWQYLKGFIKGYDKIIVSKTGYQQAIPVPQQIIQPAIDPLTIKNTDLAPETVLKHLEQFGIPTDKPIITQVSRFDKWKDPEGVLRVFQEVKKKHDCRLVLCGSMASDDPEGQEIYTRIADKVDGLATKDDIILITLESSLLVNALQRFASVVLQKSTREGFGLTVTEALWKGKPVVASNIGGIPMQIKDGETGYLVPPDDISGFAARVTHLLNNPSQASKMGQRGKEYVRKRFLITRLLSDYLDLLIGVLA